MNFWWADFIRRDEDKDGLPFFFCHSIEAKLFCHQKPKKAIFLDYLTGQIRQIFSLEYKTEKVIWIWTLREARVDL